MNVDYIKYGDIYLPALEAPKEHYDLCRFGHAYLRHLKQNKVRNIKAYMLRCIYSAPQTISHYYTAEVNHDLYGG